MPSTQSACVTLSKLFDMSISKSINSVYTVNSSANTITVIIPIIENFIMETRKLLKYLMILI